MKGEWTCDLEMIKYLNQRDIKGQMPNLAYIQIKINLRMPPQVSFRFHSPRQNALRVEGDSPKVETASAKYHLCSTGYGSDFSESFWARQVFLPSLNHSYCLLLRWVLAIALSQAGQCAWTNGGQASSRGKWADLNKHKATKKREKNM